MIDGRYWWWLAIVLVTAVLLVLLAPVLTPFLVAALLAYLVNPLVLQLTRQGCSRNWAAVVVFISLLLMVAILPLMLVPLIEKQFALLALRWPAYIDSIQRHVIPRLQALLGQQTLDISVLKQAFSSHWQQLGGTAASVLAQISRSGMVLLGWLANLVLIPVVTFYLLRDWQRVVIATERLLPRAIAPTVKLLARDCDEMLATFLRGQLTVMLALGIIYSLGLWLAGIELAMLIGMLAGLVSFVPYLGMILGLLMAGAASYMQFQDLMHLLPVLLVFGVGQLLEGFVLTPWLVGDRIGLHPVAVIFAVMAGGQLFGFFGILVALPAAAVIAVIIRYLHQRYLDSSLYGAEKDLEDEAAVNEDGYSAISGQQENATPEA